MATVLFTWELGAGLGHLSRLRPLVEYFLQQGHVTYLAIRDLRNAQRLFGDLNVQWLQAPYKSGTCQRPIDPARSFTHVLHNTGFESAAELQGLTQAWRALHNLIRPDLVVHDHSPAAIVAFRGLDSKQAIIGTGFFIPPPVTPLPDLRTWLAPAANHLAADEERTLRVINTVLTIQGSPTVDFVAQLYQNLDDQLLATYPELDLYGPRPHQAYWGVTETTQGEAAHWPAGEGPRVFAYLKTFRAFNDLMSDLRRRRLRVLLYTPSIRRTQTTAYTSDLITIADASLDIATVRTQCDLAILNGTHGVTAQMLLGGVPSLHIPIVLEQFHVARKVLDMGAGLVGDGEHGTHLVAQLDKMLESPQFCARAQRFSAQYSFLKPQEQVTKIARRLLRLCGAD